MQFMPVFSISGRIVLKSQTVFKIMIGLMIGLIKNGGA